MTLKDLLLGGSGGLFALLTILQISPIKINPWSALARSIGRRSTKMFWTAHHFGGRTEGNQIGAGRPKGAFR